MPFPLYPWIQENIWPIFVTEETSHAPRSSSKSYRSGDRPRLNKQSMSVTRLIAQLERAVSAQRGATAALAEARRTKLTKHHPELSGLVEDVRRIH